MIGRALWAGGVLAAIQEKHAFVKVLSQVETPMLFGRNEVRQNRFERGEFLTSPPGFATHGIGEFARLTRCPSPFSPETRSRKIQRLVGNQDGP